MSPESPSIFARISVAQFLESEVRPCGHTLIRVVCGLSEGLDHLRPSTKVLTNDPRRYGPGSRKRVFLEDANQCCNCPGRDGPYSAKGSHKVRTDDEERILQRVCQVGNGRWADGNKCLPGLRTLSGHLVSRNREQGLCCGAGGGQMFMEEEGTRINHIRTDQFLATGADAVGVSCPFCLQMMEEGISAKGAGDKQAKDVLELLAESLED